MRWHIEWLADGGKFRLRVRWHRQKSCSLHLNQALADYPNQSVEIFIAVRRGKNETAVFINMDTAFPHQVEQQPGKLLFRWKAQVHDRAELSQMIGCLKLLDHSPQLVRESFSPFGQLLLELRSTLPKVRQHSFGSSQRE